MHFAPNELLSSDAMVHELLRPFRGYLAIEGVTEIVVNRPGEVFVEIGPLWVRYEAPLITLQRCWSLANAIATYSARHIDAHSPILSAKLPGGERVTIIVPPITEPDAISITIRVPESITRTFEQYSADGFFSRFIWARPTLDHPKAPALTASQRRLMEHLDQEDLATFLAQAVRDKLNIVFVGDTGSGKTSLMRAACQFIPGDERLVTIEDVRELELPNHANRVHLLYSKSDGQTPVTPARLIATAMRMKPDRVLLAELRGSEAFDFLKLLTTGHSGSLSSFHAESCALALERYVFMCKEHEDARIYDADALKRLVALTIDVIVHIRAERLFSATGEAVHKDRYVSEVMYDPIAKLEARFGKAMLAPKKGDAV